MGITGSASSRPERAAPVRRSRLLSGAPRSASVRAADDLVLLSLGREEFDRQLAGRPAVRAALHRFIAEAGVQNFLKQYTALGTTSADSRHPASWRRSSPT